jgi:hypothetical protein
MPLKKFLGQEHSNASNFRKKKLGPGPGPDVLLKI